MKNARRITQWIRAGEMIPTNRGPVPAAQWCKNEAARISAAGQDAEVIERTYDRRLEVCVTRPISKTVRINKED